MVNKEEEFVFASKKHQEVGQRVLDFALHEITNNFPEEERVMAAIIIVNMVAASVNNILGQKGSTVKTINIDNVKVG